jgi:hypothetical protein
MWTCRKLFAFYIANYSETVIYYSKASREDRHKIDIKLDKQLKVEEQYNVDAKDL